MNLRCWRTAPKSSQSMKYSSWATKLFRISMSADVAVHRRAEPPKVLFRELAFGFYEQKSAVHLRA
jgi:hypothetical protein